MDRTRQNADMMIQKCREDFHRLSKWEQDFLDSIEEQRAHWRRWLPSERQFETLERIYAEKTS